MAVNLIDHKLKQVKTVEISNTPSSIKAIGDEIWYFQHDGIGVYDDKLHDLRHLKIGSTSHAS